MYSSLSSLVLAFHGCDSSVKEKIILGKDKLIPSHNKYDWLGSGIYFWKNDLDRAYSYAKFLKEHPERAISNITEPAVLGAIIDLKYCLNLFEEKTLGYLKASYNILKEYKYKIGEELPENKKVEKEGDVLIRNLDCAVIEMLHTYRKEQNLQEYDSVRSPFWEGKELYENSGFREKNYIQICIRNEHCIKGYFDPLQYQLKD
jgi:hypothetical protein